MWDGIVITLRAGTCGVLPPTNGYWINVGASFAHQFVAILHQRLHSAQGSHISVGERYAVAPPPASGDFAPKGAGARWFSWVRPRPRNPVARHRHPLPRGDRWRTRRNMGGGRNDIRESKNPNTTLPGCAAAFKPGVHSGWPRPSRYADSIPWFRRPIYTRTVTPVINDGFLTRDHAVGRFPLF